MLVANVALVAAYRALRDIGCTRYIVNRRGTVTIYNPAFLADLRAIDEEWQPREVFSVTEDYAVVDGAGQVIGRGFRD